MVHEGLNPPLPFHVPSSPTQEKRGQHKVMGGQTCAVLGRRNTGGVASCCCEHSHFRCVHLVEVVVVSVPDIAISNASISSCVSPNTCYSEGWQEGQLPVRRKFCLCPCHHTPEDGPKVVGVRTVRRGAASGGRQSTNLEPSLSLVSSSPRHLELLPLSLSFTQRNVTPKSQTRHGALDASASLKPI
eukprot:3865949-Rhodomonas_salina.2